ncbi:MAG: reverse transcriptase domain-containing protein [Chloroflexota bacterium]|jgi:retron-type reverse transcriptase
MKTYDQLYETLTSFENLYLAFDKAACGKRGQPNVADFERHLEDALFGLQNELSTLTYQPGKYTSFYIRDPKRRLISAAPFRDRVVHHALCNIIEPLFERTFIGDSYANRIGKGTHAALDRAQQFSRRYRYVLQCDIRQCFPSVDHEVLQQILNRKIRDEKVRWLCRLILQGGQGILDSEYDMVFFTGDDLFATLRPRGLPIGNLTSQFWANVYLNELDQFVKRELHCPAYVRYVDDFLFFSPSKSQLWTWKQSIRSKLAYLRMTLHEKESTVYPVSNGIPYLGFRVYPTHRRLKRRNGVAFERRLSGWVKLLHSGQIVYADIHRRVRGWIAHVSHGDTWRLRCSIFHSHPM